MVDEVPSFDVRDADVFSYGSLQLTYDVLRSNNARLALNVRNIIGSEPLRKNDSGDGDKRSNHYRVNLDSLQVRTIVEALMAQGQIAIQDKNNPGLIIMAKTLIDDWKALALKIIDDLPADQKPPNS